MLGRGEVPALVLSRQHVVNRDEDAQDEQDAGRGQRPVPGLPPRKQPGNVTPLAERVQEHADQTRDQEPGSQLGQLGLQELDHDPRADERGTEPGKRAK